MPQNNSITSVNDSGTFSDLVRDIFLQPCSNLHVDFLSLKRVTMNLRFITWILLVQGWRLFRFQSPKPARKRRRRSSSRRFVPWWRRVGGRRPWKCRWLLALRVSLRHKRWRWFRIWGRERPSFRRAMKRVQWNQELRTQNLVRFFKNFAAFRVTEDNPVDAQIFQHISAWFIQSQLPTSVKIAYLISPVKAPFCSEWMFWAANSMFLANFWRQSAR